MHTFYIHACRAKIEDRQTVWLSDEIGAFVQKLMTVRHTCPLALCRAPAPDKDINNDITHTLIALYFNNETICPS